MAGKLKYDLTGQRFGRLTVLSRTPVKDRPRWNCICDCGTEKVLPTESLLGGTKSCGCFRREWAKDKNRTHGGSKDRLYSVWNMMKQRCGDPHNMYYKNYGRRGISVCEEWKNDYGSFRKWAMDNGYDPNAEHGECTVDRIDNNGDYCPENCRFANRRVQNRNTRRNRIITFNGETKTIAEWGEVTGIKPITIHFRLKSGWTLEDALTIKPVVGRNQTWKKAN